MNKFIFILFILLSCTTVNAHEPILTDLETKNNLSVYWFLTFQGITHTEYIVIIENLENIKKDINLSSIFEPVNYNPSSIENIKLLEYEEKDEGYIWTESKPIFSSSLSNKKKVDYSNINIGKFETKIFKLSFDVPIKKDEFSYGSSTKFYLKLNNYSYHPWLNISWFYRAYLYNFTPNTTEHIKRISFNTRILDIVGNIKEDCTDIRITDSNNTELDYNLVSGCLTENTTIDIMFSINETAIYIYYGNEDALNVSDASMYEGSIINWFNQSCDNRREIIDGTNMPFVVNGTEGFNGNFSWTIDTTNLYQYYNCEDGQIYIANYTTELNWENASNPGVGGNNPTSVHNSTDTVLFLHLDDGINANDSSFYNNDGTNNGSTSISGQIGNALLLDGVLDYVLVSDSTELRFDANTKDFSVCTWINSTLNAFRVIVSKEDSANDGWRLTTNTDGRFEISINETDYFSGNNAYGIGSWYFVCAVIDRNGNVSFYVNGILSGIPSAVNSASMATTSNLVIGTTSYSVDSSEFNGTIDEVMIFNRTISLIEHQRMYWNGIDNGSYFGSEESPTLNVSIPTIYSNYTLEYQQYGPLYASVKEAFGVWDYPYTAPPNSLIYQIKIDLSSDCNFNEFDIDTNTFRFYGNVTQLFKKTVDNWDVCLVDKVNESTYCREQNVIGAFGKAHFNFALYMGPTHFTQINEDAEDFYIKYMSYGFSAIMQPKGFASVDGLITGDRIFLSYPNELNFTSNCVNNDVTIRYQTIDALRDTTQDIEPGRGGAIGFILSILGAIINLIGFVWDITLYTFFLFKFFISHIWLTFILFEIFAMMYSLKSTETITAYVGTYVKIHIEGIKFIISAFDKLANLIMKFFEKLPGV